MEFIQAFHDAFHAFICHEAGNLKSMVAKLLIVHHKGDSASLLLQALHGKEHIVIVVTDDDYVVGIVGNGGSDGPMLKAIA